MDLSEKIAQLRVVSENVDQFISNGTYVLKFESSDSITDQTLLNECFKVLVEELGLLGVIPNVEFQELIADYYDAEAIVSIRKILDQNNLIPIFRSNEDFKLAVIYLVSNKEIDESVYFSEFLDIYQIFFPGDSNIGIIRRQEAHFNSNHEFKKYLLSLERLSIPRSSLDESTAEQRALFLKKIVDGRTCFTQAVEAVLRLDPSLDKEYLTHAMNLYDVEKIQGHVLGEMAWAVMTDPETLSETAKQHQRMLLDLHKTTTTHHLEYYLTNRKRPTTEQLVELTAHHFEPGTTRGDFKLAVNDMLNDGTTKMNQFQYSVFETDDIKYILRISQEIAKLYNEE